jgi:hypothetical protein
MQFISRFIHLKIGSKLPTNGQRMPEAAAKAELNIQDKSLQDPSLLGLKSSIR